jgi:hypothetical protein
MVGSQPLPWDEFMLPPERHGDSCAAGDWEVGIGQFMGDAVRPSVLILHTAVEGEA